jgi:hypothetical protein
MAFTLQDAELIAEKVNLLASAGSDGPLAGKEAKILDAIRRAERAHDAALELASALPDAKKDAVKLRKHLAAALQALSATTINLAAFDPVLDQSYQKADADSDLPGLLRRAIRAVDSFLDEMPENETRRVRSKQPLASVPPKTDGLKALVAVLYDFWSEETALPFSEDIDVRVEGDGRKHAASPALLFVLEVARSIDRAYTIEQCSNAMRPR